MRNMIISLAACTLLGAAAYGHEADSSAPVADNATPDGAVTLKGGSVAAASAIPGVAVSSSTATGCISSRSRSLHRRCGRDQLHGRGERLSPEGPFRLHRELCRRECCITVAGGGTAVYLKNEHGVVIKLVLTEVGLKFNLSADGVHIH